ncbi:MAG: fumarylacetoacetate hydrolase family protein [Trueperaceae bacterium]
MRQSRMHLIAYRTDEGVRGAVEIGGRRVALSALNWTLGGDWPVDVESLIRSGRLAAFRAWLAANEDAAAGVPTLPDDFAPAPLLARPPKIVAVGLNYEEHATDLAEERPEEPATFMKPATTLIGPGGEVVLPLQSDRTTGEAELALVVGERCYEVAAADAPSVIAGFAQVIDMTAEDVLERNPRFLTRAKSFDTFLVLGDRLVPVDGLTDDPADLGAVEIATLADGVAQRSNRVAAMRFSPWELVAFFSAVSTLEPGDLILTGTPGAVVLSDGMRIGGSVAGIGILEATVRDRKVREGPPSGMGG